METASYRLDGVDKLPANETAEARKVLLEGLGFNPSLQLTDELGAMAEQLYPRLNSHEAAVWAQFLRGVHSKKQGHWADYSFDRVPTEVLEDIAFAESCAVFSDIEIWTRQARGNDDPMVIGVIGEREQNRMSHPPNNASSVHTAQMFKVARWGESLAAFEEIETEVFNASLWPRYGLDPSKLPTHVVNYARAEFAQRPNRTIDVEHAFRRHCHRKMYRVNQKLVCGVCGHVRS